MLNCSGLCRNKVLHRHVRQLTNNNVLGNLAMRDLYNRAIQKLLLVDLAKTQYTRDDEEPYFCINVEQHR